MSRGSKLGLIVNFTLTEVKIYEWKTGKYLNKEPLYLYIDIKLKVIKVNNECISYRILVRSHIGLMAVSDKETSIINFDRYNQLTVQKCVNTELASLLVDTQNKFWLGLEGYDYNTVSLCYNTLIVPVTVQLKDTTCKDKTRTMLQYRITLGKVNDSTKYQEDCAYFLRCLGQSNKYYLEQSKLKSSGVYGQGVSYWLKQVK